MSSLSTDFRQALVWLARHPGFAALVVLMIALGIAGNAAVFRIFDGLFLRPLPFSAPEQLMDFDETAPAWGLDYTGMAYPDFVEWRRSNETFSDMAVFNVYGINVAVDGATSRGQLVQSTYDLPDVLGLVPVEGRFFSAAEDTPGGAKVALVSETYWRARLGGNAQVIGSTLTINSVGHEIIGVFPDVMKRVAAADIWTPLAADENSGFGWYLRGVGRLAPGVTREQALADLTNIHKSLIDTQPANEITSPVLQSMTDRYLGRFRLGSWALLGATGLLLLIACTNIAALMLARSIDRYREFGIRMAIGSSRRRLIRLLLTESLVLGIVGGLVGTVVGYLGSELVVDGIAERFAGFVVFDLNWRFMAFIVLVTLAGTTAFALLPSLSTSSTRPGKVLSNASSRASDSKSKLRTMNLLVVGEVALALLLLIAGGLFLRDLNRLLDADPGFETENLLTYGFDMPANDFPTAEERGALVESHLEQVRALPGVVNASAATSLPLSGHWGWAFEAEGAEPLEAGEANPIVLNRVVADDYFETMGVRVAAGRPFERGEGRTSPLSVIVNEAFARAFFPGVDNPVGRRIRVANPNQNDVPWMTIVGMTYDVSHYGLETEMRPGVYRPADGYPINSARIAVRTAVPPMSIVPAVRDLMHEANGSIALFGIATMDQTIGDSLWARKASSWLTATFSAVALILAVAGVYGVIAHSIRRRETEICIRMALGASHGQVIGHVLKHGLLIVGVGVAIGLAVMLGMSQLISSLVLRVAATDPTVYISVTLLLILAAVAASLMPALRLIGLNPAGALRSD